jgi:glycosyltransferase involved in cell wall biosynthesis
MKIVHVVTRADVQGGAQTHVLELCRALSSAGHQVVVITGCGDALDQRLAAARIAHVTLPCLIRPVRPWKDLEALLLLSRQLRLLQPDLVCAHTAKAGWIARIAARAMGIPCTFTPHGWSVVDRSSQKLKSGYLLLERLAGATGARIINVCEHERALAESLRVASPEFLDVVHNGLPEEAPPRITSVDLQPPRIVMIARYEIQKDHATLLSALSGLTHLPWTLALVGEGERRRQVEERIRDAALCERVELLPPETDVARLLSAAQIHVLATQFEAFPISILEAMRAALPVIATNVGGIAEAVIHQHTGLLVPPRDVDALRRALQRLILEPALRVALGSAGKARFASRFTAEIMAARTLDVYARACHAAAHPRLVAKTT